jgi:hypothetical protein
MGCMGFYGKGRSKGATFGPEGANYTAADASTSP